MRFLAPILLLLVFTASADTLNDGIQDSGQSIKKVRTGMTLYHSATGTVSLDNAVDVQACKVGLDIWFNPDFTGTAVDATYTLYNCPRNTASANYATECIPANFDPDGGGADTNVMTAANDSLHIWNLRIRYFGATITAGGDTAQATIRCM